MPEHVPQQLPRHARPDTASLLAVAVGGVVGGYLRVGLSLAPFTGSSASWPWVTFGVNVAGTFVLALTAGTLRTRARVPGLVGPLVGVGFCGALTTFSTLQLEVFRMLRAHQQLLAVAYLGASIAAGLAAASLGLFLVRRVAR